MKHVPNHALEREMIPDSDATWGEIQRFALSFDGYKVHRSFKKCAEIANDRRRESLSDQRTCLFFDQRRRHHFGGEPDEETLVYIRSLVEEIKARVIEDPPDVLQVSAKSSFFFEGQIQHLLLLVVMLLSAWAIASPVFDGDNWLGIDEFDWFLACLIVPVVQQVFGWLVFRGQLCFRFLTRVFGRADFLVWGVLFIPLLIARPLLLIAHTIADRGSLEIPGQLAFVVGILLALPALYTGWSVVKYFGFARAMGGDHFREKYRHMPLVHKGAFRWSSNAMYSFVFLMLWSIALIGRSQAALAVALFQHAYVWVHMHFTEAPDMKVVY